ncbi:MAG TPA: hypothetical protein RMH99_16590 [Sandaracinaceae bacterium LLY-WYZ-13_1]|nr:hypothetical protein [Sandaracinaceae bacterium LLY-WYZ-13_1]
MLDTDAHRFDVAAIVRAARAESDAPLVWRAYRGHRVFGVERQELVHEAELRVDEGRGLLFVNDQLVIELDHLPVRVPTSGRVVRGAVLARCPRGCGRRARVLWVRPWDEEFFPVCRACSGIEYATAKVGELERARIALRRLRAALGVRRHVGHEPRPGQHRRTYLRDARRLEEARQRVRRAEEAEVAALRRAWTSA